MAWQDTFAALEAALPSQTVDPFDYATGVALGTALTNAGLAYDAAAQTTVSVPQAKIYTGVAPDRSTVVSFYELATVSPLAVAPVELFKAGKYLMTLCGITGTMFDNPIPPCPNYTLQVVGGNDVVVPDMSFAIGWAYVARDAYKAALISLTPPPPSAVAFYAVTFVPMTAAAAAWATFLRTFPTPAYAPGALTAPTSMVIVVATAATTALLNALNAAVTNAVNFIAYLRS
jgi:hypothetical protein